MREKNRNEETDIHLDFQEQMTYGDYLDLERLLSSQHRLSGHHDEMLFILIHQVQELWMKLILHELNAAVEAIEKGELSASFKMLARVSSIESQMIQACPVHIDPIGIHGIP